MSGVAEGAAGAARVATLPADGKDIMSGGAPTFWNRLFHRTFSDAQREREETMPKVAHHEACITNAAKSHKAVADRRYSGFEVLSKAGARFQWKRTLEYTGIPPRTAEQ